MRSPAMPRLCQASAFLSRRSKTDRNGRHKQGRAPGVGRLAYNSIQNSDFPVIQGTVLLAAMFIIVANIVVDIIYAYLDPRVRFS